MNRRNFLHTAMIAGAALALPVALVRAADGKVGGIDPNVFKKTNDDANKGLAAIEPTADALSDADQKLLTEVALGGLMQLELSKVAVEKAASADVKLLAQAEVDEQTGLSAKLKEVATAKKAKLPEGPDEKIQKAVAKLQEKSGAEFDKAYVKESGVSGHKKLQSTMEKVQNKATDATLKKIAAGALPLIKVHLDAAKAEEGDI